MDDRDTFENNVNEALRALLKFGNGIVSRLSGRESNEEAISNMVEKWTELSRIVSGAMRDFNNGLSIKQSRYQSHGVHWVDTSLTEFITAVNRIVYTAEFNDEEVKEYVRKQGVSAVDMTHDVLWHRLMTERPSGGSVDFKQSKELLSEENLETQDRCSCPFSSCNSSFGTTKALNFHIKKYHPNKEANVVPMNVERVRCALCPADKPTVDRKRMKEHLLRVHKRGPYTKDIEFRGFEETSPGSYEPIFLRANTGRNLSAESISPLVPAQMVQESISLLVPVRPVPNLGTDSPGGVSSMSAFASPIKTFASMSDPPSHELVFRLSMEENLSDSELGVQKIMSSTPDDASMVPIKSPQDKFVSLGARRKLNLSSGKSKQKKKKKIEVISKEDWTDYEDGDNHEYTETRRIAKEARYQKRLIEKVAPKPLYEEDGNKDFIDEFNDYVKTKKQQFHLHKYTRTLFRGQDNWLDHITEEKNGNFKLEDLVDWTGPRLAHPGPPDSWLQKVPECPKKGSKKTEMVKAYSKLFTYLTGLTQKRMLENASDYENNIRLNFHKELLIAAKEKMLSDGNLSNAKALAKEHVEKKKTNMNILYPNLAQSIRDCVKIWNQSQTKADDLKKFVNIYDAAKKTRQVTSSNYSHCLQHTIMSVALLNANRKKSIEALKNSDFRAAKKVYQTEEGEELLTEGGEFFGKYVELLPSSGASKTGNPVTIFFNVHILDLMHMLKDLASWFFVGDMKDKLGGQDLNMHDAPLFNSANGKPAKVDKTTYQKFADESNLPSASANTIRQTATTAYRNDPKIRAHESRDMDHNENVATDHYDKGVQERKVRNRQMIHQRNDGSVATLSTIDYEIDETTRERWRKEEDLQDTIMKEEAAKYLKDSRHACNPVKSFSSQWKVLPDDRETVTKAMLSAHGTEIYSRVSPPAIFPIDKPNNSYWTRTFYRYIDTMEDTELGLRVREVEARIFNEVVKPELIRQDVWKEGEVDKGQQRTADREVAGRLRTSFWNQYKSVKSKPKGTADPVFLFSKR